jgi:hypothetical protein
MTASFEAKSAQDAENPDLVKIRLDRPGVAAVSYTGDAYEIIKDIAAAAGLEVAMRSEDAEDG